MIKVNIYKKEKQIEEVVIKGHAGYDRSGFDIVCASVSSMVITTVNAIIRYRNDSIEYEEKDGFVSIKIINHDEVVDLLMINLLDLLEKLEKQYQKYVKLNKEVSSC